MPVETGIVRRFRIPPRHVLTVRLEFDARGKVVDLAMVVTLHDGRVIARLDTCHGTLHTHYYGLDGLQDETRIVREILPAAPDARADRLHTIYEDCYDVMIGVAEGRSP